MAGGDYLEQNRRDAAAILARAKSKTTPEQAANAARIAARYGVSPEVAAAATPAFDQQAHAEEAGAAAAGSPATAKWLFDDPNRVALARGNYAGLVQTDQVVRKHAEQKPVDWVALGLAGYTGGLETAAFNTGLQAGGVTSRAYQTGQITPANIGRGLYAGVFTTAKGVLHTAENLFGLSAKYSPGSAAQEALFGTSIDRQIETNLGLAAGQAENAATSVRPRSDNADVRAVFAGVESVPTMAAAIFGGWGAKSIGAVSTIAGEAKVASGIGALVQYGSSYGDARREGLGIERASAYALADAGWEYFGERIPMHYIFGDIAAHAGIGRRLFHTLLSEVPTEVATAWGQNFDRWVAIEAGQGKTFGEFLGEQGQSARETAIAAAVGASAASVGLRAVDYAINKVNRRVPEVAQASRATEFLAQLGELAKADQVLKRDPQSYEQFVATVGDHSGVSDVFVQADQLAQVLQQAGLTPEQVFETTGMLPEDILRASHMGQTVSIPIEVYASRIAQTDLNAALLPHMRTDPALPSYAEAETFMQGVKEELDAGKEEAFAQGMKVTEREASRANVRDTVLAELNQTGRFASRTNEVYADLTAAFFDTTAAKLSMTAEELFKQFALNVQSATHAQPTFDHSPQVEHLVNIGLDMPDGSPPLATEQVRAALASVGVHVQEDAVHQSDTEQTLVARLDRALTAGEAHALSAALGQEAITTYSGGDTGALHGPAKHNWGPFNPQYFVLLNGSRLADNAAPAPLDGRHFRDFFSGITKGESGAPKVRNRKRLMKSLSKLGDFSKRYKKYLGKFDDHIGASIPGFRDLQQVVGAAIVKAIPEGGALLDIAGSEGALAKAVAELRPDVETVVLDPNQDMQTTFAKKGGPANARYDLSAFTDTAEDAGQVQWTEDNGVPILGFQPDRKYDVVHEAMGFQFIHKGRAAQLARVRELMAPGGIAIFEEKYIPGEGLPQEQWDANEAQKDEFKHQFFTNEDIEAKKKAILESRAEEEKTVGMTDLMVSPGEFERVLTNTWGVAAQFWDSGNFKGYVASDSAEALQRFLANLEDTTTEFSTTSTPRPVAADGSIVLSQDAIWYSALERAVENSKQNKASAAQWLGMFYTPESEGVRAVKDAEGKKVIGPDGRPVTEAFTRPAQSNTPGVTLDETQWVSFVDWLREADGAVLTKEQVLEYVRARGVVLSESVHGELADAGRDIPDRVEWVENYVRERRQEAVDEYYESGYYEPQYHVVEEEIEDLDAPVEYTPTGTPKPAPTRTVWRVSYDGGDTELVYDTEEEAQEAAYEADGEDKAEAAEAYADSRRTEFVRQAEDAYDDISGGANRVPKFARYTEGGMGNRALAGYHELLLTLPLGVAGNPKRGIDEPHWDEEGVIAHLRYHDSKLITDTGVLSSEAVMDVQEFQTDWIQKGRDKGWAVVDPAKVAAAQEAEDAAREAVRAARARYTAILGLHYETIHEAARVAWQTNADALVADHIRRTNDTEEEAVRAQATVIGALRRTFWLHRLDEGLGRGALSTETIQDILDATEHTTVSTGGTLPPDVQRAFREVIDAGRDRDAANDAFSRAAEALRLVAPPEGVPDAPFKSSWETLLLKRAIRWAADHGYDHITWTTGDQQNRRYNLAEAVGALDIRVTDSEPGPLYDLTFHNSGANRVLRDQLGVGPYAAAQIEDVIGRDLGRRAVAQAHEKLAAFDMEAFTVQWNAAIADLDRAQRAREDALGALRVAHSRWMDGGGTAAERDAAKAAYEAADKSFSEALDARDTLVADTTVTLEGDDLQVGGAAMRKFYDEKMVNIANKLLKKWGGRVRHMRVDDGRETEEQARSAELREATRLVAAYGQRPEEERNAAEAAHAELPHARAQATAARKAWLDLVAEGDAARLAETDRAGDELADIMDQIIALDAITPGPMPPAAWQAHRAQRDELSARMRDAKEAFYMSRRRQSSPQMVPELTPTYDAMLAARDRAGDAERAARPYSDYLTHQQTIVDLTAAGTDVNAPPGSPRWGFEVTDAMKSEALGGFAMWQKTGQPRGQIAFPADITQAPSVISLLRGADRSTFVHELGHFFFEVTNHIAKQKNAPAEVVADRDALLRFLKINDVTGYEQASPAQRREWHERVARAFEFYTAEGVAPSLELKGTFRKLAAWMKQVYRRLTRLNVELTDDVRGVFNRMLASDQAIAEAEADALMQPKLRDKPEGMTEADWQDYQTLNAEATEEAAQQLAARSLRDMRYSGRAVGREMKRLQAQVKEQRRAVREEVVGDLKVENVYRAIELIRSGRVNDTQLVAGSAKLDRDAVRVALGLSEGEKLPDQFRGLTTPDGIAPQQIAEYVGYPSAAEMLHDINFASPFKDAVEAETDNRMRERYGEVSTPEDVLAAARAAVHNDVRARFVATELAALQNAPGKRRVLDAAARQIAADMVSKLRLRDLRPARFEADARRAAKAAQAAGGNDLEEAVRQTRNQLLNVHAAKEAHAAVEEHNDKRTYLNRFLKANTRKDIDPAFLDQIDAILERYELKPISDKEADRRKSLGEWVNQMQEEGFDPVLDPETMAAIGRKAWRDLTVGEMRSIVEGVKNIAYLGRMTKKLLTARDKASLDEAANEVADLVRDTAFKTVPENIGPATWAEGKWQQIGEWFAFHRKLGNLVYTMDGNKYGGPVWERFMRGLNEAADRETQMIGEAGEKLAGIFALIAGENTTKREVVPGVGALSLEARLMVALNWGNSINRARILDGDKWTPQQVEEVLRPLKSHHWDFVEQVWSFVDGYWPEIAAKERRVSGVEPEKVEAEPFQIALEDGATRMVRGGYFPIKYDPLRSSKAEAHNLADIAKNTMMGAFTRATTRRGHTKQRVDTVKRPLRKDFGVLFGHVTTVVHDLTHHEVLIDVNRLLRHGAVDAAIREHYGPATLTWMRRALEDIAAGDTPAQNAVEVAARYVRTGTSVASMGWNLWTMMSQPLGLTQSASRIGVKWVARGVSDLFKDPAGANAKVGWIYEQSPFMRDRALTMQREIAELRNRLAAKGPFRTAMERVVPAPMLDAVGGSYFYLIGKGQLVADLPTWLGQYSKSIEAGEDHDRAVNIADQAVIDSQGSGLVKDLAGVQRGSEMLRLWTNFYSYFNATYNLMADRTNDLRRVGVKDLPYYAVDMLLLSVVPATLTSLLYQLLHGMIPGAGDDDDHDWGDVATRVAADNVQYLLGTMVGVREVAGALSGSLGYSGPAGARVFSELGRLGKQTAQGEADEAAFRAANSVAGILFHYPATQLDRSVRGTLTWLEGDAPPTAPLVGPPPKNR